MVLSLSILKAVPLQTVVHTEVFSRAGTEMLSRSHDSSIFPVTSIVPVKYLPPSALNPQQL